MATSFEPSNGQLKAQFADFELDLSSGELIRENHRFGLQGQPSLWGFLSGRHLFTFAWFMRAAAALSQCPASSSKPP
jgi:hypothetical protein